MPDLRLVAAELGAAAPERVLVFGSLPERAADLDVLARPAALASLEAWLPTVGFVRGSAGWVRIDAELTAVVELRAAADWGLSPALTADLYERAVPLEGLGALAVPAPAHALLVLARRLQTGGGRLDHRRLERARAALCQDPDALTAARELAKGWRCAGALEVLAADLDGSLRRSRRHQLLARDGIPSVPRWRSAVRAVRRQRARHRAG